MTKKTGRMALYEAIGASKGSLTGGKTHNSGTGKQDGHSQKVAGIFGKKFYLELDISKIAISLLALLVLLLGAFKIGQLTSRSRADAVAISDNTSSQKIEKNENVAYVSQKPTPKPRATVYVPPKPTDKLIKETIKPQKPAVATTKKNADNVICVTRYMIKRDLIPVKEYFAKNGIELEIIKKSNNYLLITKKRYTGGFTRIGTEAYNDLRKIKRIGAYYSAPEEFEPFGSKPFQDAYGMKLKK